MKQDRKAGGSSLLRPAGAALALTVAVAGLPGCSKDGDPGAGAGAAPGGAAAPPVEEVGGAGTAAAAGDGDEGAAEAVTGAASGAVLKAVAEPVDGGGAPAAAGGSPPATDGEAPAPDPAAAAPAPAPSPTARSDGSAPPEPGAAPAAAAEDPPVDAPAPAPATGAEKASAGEAAEGGPPAVDPKDFDAYAAAKGDENIAAAKELIQQGDLKEALNQLELGVSRAPANLDGRVLLSRLYLKPEVAQPEAALTVMVDGMRHARDNPDYLDEAFKVLLTFEQNETVIAQARAILPPEPEPVAVNVIGAAAAATAHYNRYELDQAEQLIEAYALHRTLEGLLLWARILWEQELQKEALLLLEAALQQRLGEDRILSLAGKLAREVEDYSRALRFARRRTINHPLDPIPRLEVIYTLHLAGDEPVLSAKVDTFFDAFGREPGALLGLANFATDYGRVDLMWRIYRQAEKHKFNLVPFQLLLLETHLEANRYEQVLLITDEAERGKYPGLEKFPDVLSCVRSVALFGTGRDEEGARHLGEALDSQRIPADLLRSTAERLGELGKAEELTRTLQRALSLYPLDQDVHIDWVKHLVAVGEAEGVAYSASLLLGTRKMDLELMEGAHRLLSAKTDLPDATRQKLLPALRDEIDRVHKAKSSGRRDDPAPGAATPAVEGAVAE